MIQKKAEKEKAIQLRKKGKTYNEILAVVPVAKSTLSLWLRDIGLAKRQVHRLTKKKFAAAKRGGAARKQQRIERYNIITDKTRSEIGAITDRELFLIGVALYWAEGAKEKEYRAASGFRFCNMDARVLILMLEWLERVCKIDKSMIGFDLYLHETHRHRAQKVLKYWARTLHIPKKRIALYYKKFPVKTNRKNTGENYHGVFRLNVHRVDLVRKITGWFEGVYEGIDK